MNSITWIREYCEDLSVPQQRNLALMVDAVLKEQNSILNNLGVFLAIRIGIALKHAVKRIQRFLKNDNFQDEVVFKGIIDMIWTRLDSWEYIPVIIDWTPNEKKGKWKILKASIPLRGRGIPIMGWAFRKNDLGSYLSQNHLERDFVNKLLALLPEDKRIVLIADRGFGRASFFDFLSDLGVKFIIRVKMNSWIESKKYCGRLDEMTAIKPGKSAYFRLTDCLYHKKEKISLAQLVVAYDGTIQEDGTIDPWFLAMNFRMRVKKSARFFSKRMIIEQDFREAKSHLGWKECRIKKLSHYRRFVTVLILALVFAVLIGTVVHRRPTLLKLVSRKKDGKPDTSLTYAALRLLSDGLEHMKYLRWAKLAYPLRP